MEGENISPKCFIECWLIKGLSSCSCHCVLHKSMAELNTSCALSLRKQMLCIVPWEYQILGGNLLLNTLLMCTIKHCLGELDGKFHMNWSMRSYCHKPMPATSSHIYNTSQRYHQPPQLANPIHLGAIRSVLWLAIVTSQRPQLAAMYVTQLRSTNSRHT
jgi:hypothetical protein